MAAGRQDIILISLGVLGWLLGLAGLLWLLSDRGGPAFAALVLGFLGCPILFALGVRTMLKSFFHRLLTSENNLQTLQQRLTEMKTRLSNVQKRMSDRADSVKSELTNEVSLVDQKILTLALQSGHDVTGIFTTEDATKLIRALSGTPNVFLVTPFIKSFPHAIDGFNLRDTRQLMKGLRDAGFYIEALVVMERLAELSGKDSDQLALEMQHSRLGLLRGDEKVSVEFSRRQIVPNPAKVLHFVGKALPETQTGYTLRTQYTVEAQKRIGIEPIVVMQAGASTAHAGETVTYMHNGIKYIILAGPMRNETPWGEWFNVNAAALAEVVEREEPALLHSHSDFINAEIAQSVADAYGLPHVNETRGFWEESWLSRTATRHGWKNLDLIRSSVGLPTAYEYRKDREIELRSRATAVVTLAEVMVAHINELAAERDAPVDSITMVPNAVDPAVFPVVDKNEALLRQLSFTRQTKIVGYISSIVEYEGIDILIKAFASFLRGRQTAADGSAGDVKLLIVGDGPVLEDLIALAEKLGIEEEVMFTGRIPHEEVIDYYSLIDLFVVPRKSSDVTELVTPLKPFEAMSTGRACVFSDVAALKEIAGQSGAPELFEADNLEDLAGTIAELIDDDARLQEMGSRGAAWVREERTWDSNAIRYGELYRRLGMIFSEETLAEMSALAEQNIRS